MGGVHGVIAMILADEAKLKVPKQKACTVVVFDADDNTESRQKIDATYKGNRIKADGSIAPDIGADIKLLKSIFKFAGRAVLQVPGVEADDVISVLTGKLLKDPQNVVIICTNDKDMLPLTTERNGKYVCQVYSPQQKRLLTDEDAVEKFGVPTRLIHDYLALAGDGVDNVGGGKGIGPKKALTLLKAYGSLKNILKNTQEQAARLDDPLLKLVCGPGQKKRIRKAHKLVTAAKIKKLPELKFVRDQKRLNALLDKYGLKQATQRFAAEIRPSLFG
jgi:DNA polymerase-1